MPQDDTKVFDVSKPHKVTPSPTSKPVIVGHHPIMNDPMVKEESPTPPEADFSSEESNPSTPIHVSMDDSSAHSVTTNSEPESTEPSSAFAATSEEESPADNSIAEAAAQNDPLSQIEAPQESEDQLPEENQTPVGDQAVSEDLPTHTTHTTEEVVKEKTESTGSSFTPLSSLLGKDEGSDDAPARHKAGSTIPPTGGHLQDVEPLSIPKGAGPRRRWPKFLAWLFSLVAAVVVAGYLAIDLGLVRSDIKLPFSIFGKQKSSESTNNTTPPPAPPATPPPATVPLGFTLYQISETPISFAYPDTWGAPTATKDAGFSKRGGDNKSDGTYAYLVNFANKKDVQLAFTSSKYLPAKRDALYYDNLQWCVGTNDSKYYLQSLQFTTDDNVDTPGTITCDKGPLEGVAKIDDKTVSVAKAKDSKGAQIGDIYIKNLDHDEYSVVRAKDSSMKNVDLIKQLLGTVKAGS